jgi:uncharacterized protein
MCLCAAGWAADWRALKPQGYVSDFAGAVDSASASELGTYCAALEKATGAHLSLVIIGSLQKEPVYDVARAISQAWAVGLAAPGDSLLLLISVGDRRDALVVGRGLRETIDSGAVDDILAEARPALSRRQYGQALMAAADEIGSRIATARHKTVAVPLTRRAHRTIADSIPWPLVAGSIPLIVLLVWLLRRPKRQPSREPV